MSDENFPLCRKAGLPMSHVLAGYKMGPVLGDIKTYTTIDDAYILASDVERLLSQAAVVTSGWEPADDGMATTHIWRTSCDPHPNSTHKARLLMIEPIKKDTTEDLLREFIIECENERGYDFDIFVGIKDRAKRLLENT